MPDALHLKDMPAMLQDLPVKSSIPGLPTEVRYYEMSFRYGNIPHLTKVFPFPGGLRDATLRAQQHCLKMNYRHIWTRPFIVDLDAQEKLKDKYPDEFQDVAVAAR